MLAAKNFYECCLAAALPYPHAISTKTQLSREATRSCSALQDILHKQATFVGACVKTPIGSSCETVADVLAGSALYKSKLCLPDNVRRLDSRFESS